jgi:microsomal dipeptidase-like Zn-dependent dipeptidase
MVIDMHAHYPMHLKPGRRDQPSSDALTAMINPRRPTLGDRIRALILDFFNRIANYPTPSGPAVTIPNLRTGDVGIVWSVLYAPFDEMDLSKPYGAPPSPTYFADLTDQLKAVEDDIATNFKMSAAVVHNHDELQQALASGRVALIHAVEGGFHLGDIAEIDARVAELAGLGVVYITVAHLFFRRVATNAPALPFLPDGVYGFLFPQPPSGLCDRGRALITAMVKNHILIDITHMSAASIDETFTLLDQVDPQHTAPVVATHSACQFGRLKYNISDEHIAAVAKRHGVVGLIACKHYMADGGTSPETFDDSMDVIFRHVDRIKDVTGCHAHTGLGSDLDGFIKPTLPGLETPAALRQVEERLSKKYGDAVAEQICSGNALRVLKYWRA